MEKKESKITTMFRAIVRICLCCAGSGTAYLAQKESMKSLDQKKGTMEYYDRLG